MTLLDEWRAKPSYQATLPLCPVYQSRMTGQEDIDLAALCSREETLTLQREKGFAEIAVKGTIGEMPEGWRYLAEALPKYSAEKWSSQDIAQMLVWELHSYIVRFWDSKRRKVMFCSGGLDSRILAWVLANLRDVLGRDWLGNIVFVCHHPESEQFLPAMAQMGWEANEYHVHRANRRQSADYYNLGGFANNANGYYGLTWTFWNEVISPEEEHEAVLISGSYNGELLNYPLWQGVADNRFAAAFPVERDPLLGRLRGRLYLTWHDILTPYLSYEYLDTALRLPAEYFVRTPRLTTTGKKGPDLMRALMLEEVSRGIPLAEQPPVYQGHKYDFTISKKRAAYLKAKWQGSCLYHDFKHLDWVKDAKPWTASSTRDVLHGQDSKLYSYATMYEHIERRK